ncbi:MAG: bifunctional phosphopantothenoylcysteine decarboxylase/phosphopantothenate--cysteine ligase CoaBC [Gammaproteobacteria bacterium]|nr:bifunctional phosphopantothenoylcysteine decarboxylase/phosphopantothenate--cysteine ligase CoaBC [Gammaproteobacteria bacterium]
MSLAGKHILLGVTGGIAAYKAAILVRHLCNEGAEVQVVLTQGAAQFVTPVTLQALSGRPVRDDLWDQEAEAAMGHIELARWADLILVAPATAHFMANLAQGAAPDLLTTLCLASDAPVLLAPAMNQAMWRDAATQRNAATLAADGKRLIGPDDGEQACGDVGPGRMAEPEALLDAVRAAFQSPRLADLNVLVTAGPTREALDPVRFLSNHSSGKQGYAIAKAAADAGARVTLVSGPCGLPAPANVERIEVTSALDMHEAVQARAAEQALVIGVAAVADYRPAAKAPQKIKKERAAQNDASVALVENPDIIASVAALPNAPVVVGFAAETENALDNARRKRRRKGLDAIVVNDVSDPKIGFNSDHNAATLIWADGEVELAYQGKEALAASLIQHLANLFFPSSGEGAGALAKPTPLSLAQSRRS